MLKINLRNYLTWQTVNRTMPHAKLFASSVGWINSAATNIISMVDAASILYVHKTQQTDVPASVLLLGIVIGLFLFIFLTGGQIFALGANNQTAYMAFLIPDVAMTAYQWRQAILFPLLSASFGGLQEVTIGSWILGAAIGILSAKLPEWLTFGERKEQPKGKNQPMRLQPMKDFEEQDGQRAAIMRQMQQMRRMEAGNE